MTNREKRYIAPADNAFAEKFGYSRGLRVGDHVYIAGTTAMDGSEVVGEGDPAAQARHIFDVIKRALADLRATPGMVVRTRIFLTDIAHLEAVGAVHREVLGRIAPVATAVEVSALADPRLLVEIEVDAYDHRDDR